MKGVVVVILVVLSLFAGRSTGWAFGECFTKCYLGCSIGATIPFKDVYCAGKCGSECYSSSTTFNDNPSTSTYNFCRLGCATSLCTNFSPKNDLATIVKEVRSCADSCSRRCMKT